MIQVTRYHRQVLIVIVCAFWTGLCIQQPSNNVTDPKEIRFKERGETVHGDSTVHTVLPTPSEFSNIVEITIQQGSQFCNVQKIDPNLIRNTILSIQDDGPQILNAQWNVEIMSSTINEENNIIYTLLDNGSLIITQSENSDNGITYTKKLFSFEGIGTVDTWLIQKHELYHYNLTLYCLKGGVLRTIDIHQQGYWRYSLDVIKDNVISLSIAGNIMFVMTLDELAMYGKGTKLPFAIQKGERFIDFVVDGLRYYILDQSKSLRMGLISKSYSAQYFIVSIENVRKIEVHGSVLFLLYQLQNRNYLAQYFIIGNDIILNRYYYNYYSIEDIHISEKYAILNGYNEFVIFHHSINRKSFTNLHETQFLYKSHGVRVVDIKIVRSIPQLQFIVIQKQKIQLITVKNTVFTHLGEPESYAINNLFVTCKSDKAQSFIASIYYKGTCSSSNYTSQSHFCSETISSSVNFQYSHVKRMEEQRNTKFILILVFIIIIIFVSLALIGQYKKISIYKKKLQASQKARKNKVEQHSINMEQTFNVDVIKEK